MNAEQVINAFIAAFDRKDLEGALGRHRRLLLRQRTARRHAWARQDARIPGAIMGGSEPVQFEVLRQATSGKLVMNERIDRFVMNGKQIALPVSGVFEVTDGRISFWRDDSDNGMFMKQLKGE